MTDGARPWPADLSFDSAAKTLRITFGGGERVAIPFELLRVESPSAEVQGHSAGEKALVTGKENVGVTRAEPVGNYAVRIVFDDGHDTGLFTWDYLAKLGREQERLMAAYRERVGAG